MSFKGAVRVTLGKAGLTPAFIQQLNALVEHHKHVRISLLPASGRNRENIMHMSSSLIQQLAFPCDCTIIGFTIVLRRRMKK